MYRNKPVTKKDLANSIGVDVSMIEQVGSKQLFIVRYKNYKALYSYFTKVGQTFADGEKGVTYWLLTTTKYSPTTSKQMSQFASDRRRNGYEIRYSDEV